MRQLISGTEAINLGCARRISQVVSKVSADTIGAPGGRNRMQFWAKIFLVNNLDHEKGAFNELPINSTIQ